MIELTDNDKIITFNKLEKLLKETDARIVAGDARLYWLNSQWEVHYRKYHQRHDRVIYTGNELFDALTSLRERATTGSG